MNRRCDSAALLKKLLNDVYLWAFCGKAGLVLPSMLLLKSDSLEVGENV